MRALFLFAAALPVFALSNAVTIQEKSGSTQTNRAITIPRYFAQGELCNYPQPYVGGSAVAFWQVDVKNRWPAEATCPGGSAKFALVTVELTLTGNSSTAVEFRNSVSLSASSGSGMTKAQMLAYDAGLGASSWGAKLTAGVGALSASISARDMIGNNHYQVLENGPVRTSILVREGPDAVSAVTTRTTSIGFQCTANCTEPYGGATWADNSAYYSMRPSFVVTFYTPHTGTGSVEVDFVLDNGWIDRAQDQRIESLALYNNGAEDSACYTAPATFVIPFRSRMFENCWTTTPGAINIDFNRAYTNYSKVLPAYGLNWIVGQGAITLEMGSGASTSCTTTSCTFATSDQGATTNATISPHMGWGQDSDFAGATGGTSPVIGFLPRWLSRYVNSFDYQLLPLISGTPKAGMHMPIFTLENRTTATYLTGSPTIAFGRFVSIDGRPTIQVGGGAGTLNADAPKSPHGDTVCNSTFLACPVGATTCVAPNCMVTCSGATLNFCNAYSSTNTVNKWRQELGHAREAFLVPYLFTGKYVYLEGEQAIASWDILNSSSYGDPPNAPYSRWGNRGLIYEQGNTIRSTAWALRNVSGAALISVDGTTEKAYFLQKLNNNLENNEGRYGITNGSFPPVNSSCVGFNKATETSIWRMGRCYYENGWTNPLASSMQHEPTLGNLCEGCDGSKEADGGAPWMENYWVSVLAQMRDWGFSSASLHEATAKRTMHMFTDPAFLSTPAAGPAEAIIYRMPILSGTAQTGNRTGYIQTWAAVQGAHFNGTSLAKPLDNSSTTLNSLDWGDAQNPAANLYDATIKLNVYYKIDNEYVFMSTLGSLVAKSISSVNTSTETATSVAHGLSDGDRIMLVATTLDSGIVGNTNCRMFSGGRNNYCSFWVHVVDADNVRFYNDAAQTSLVNLSGGGVAMTMNYRPWTITRGALGSTAASHTVGTAVQYWPVIAPPSRVTNPDAHGFFYTAGIAGAMDYDMTISTEASGATVRAQRAWEIIDSTIYNQQIAGSNVANCSAAGLTDMNCDNPTWGIRPRPLIRNVRVIPSSTSLRFYYTAPDGNACKVGVSTTPFASTDDSGDTSDSQKNLGRILAVTGLAPGTTYNYRITCGPSGGAGRVSGRFATL